MKTLNQKGISTTAIVLIVGIIIIAGGLVWWNLSDNTDSSEDNNDYSQNTNNTNVSSVPAFNTNVVTSNWREYKDEELNISFKYSSDYEVLIGQNNTLNVTKNKYIDFEGGYPSISISRESQTIDSISSLEDWIKTTKEVTQEMQVIPGKDIVGLWYEIQYSDNRKSRIYHIAIGEQIYIIYTAAFFDHDMIDVSDGIVSSLKQIN